MEVKTEKQEEGAVSKYGRCDLKRYEHFGFHERIYERGQRLPPFACVNFKPDLPEPSSDSNPSRQKSLEEIAEKASASFVDDHGLREYFIGQDLRRAFLSDLTLACQSCDDHGLRRAFLSALAEACQSRDQRIQKLEEALEHYKTAKVERSNCIPPHRSWREDDGKIARAALSEEKKK